MNKTIVSLNEIKLVGISSVTSNTNEMNEETAKIGATMQNFFGSGMQSNIFSRKNPGTLFSVYTNYESDENSKYTYFFGEEVNDFQNTNNGFEAITIPSQTYVKFTSDPGKMPDVCINMWQKIWKMKASDLGGIRSYISDFEVYNDQINDCNKIILDIYIGIK